MSEFSESYHLKADDINVGVKWLQTAGVGGFVFPAVNGWVTILPDTEAFIPDEELIALSSGILFYYSKAEDFGWRFILYVNGQVVSSYSCAWMEDIEVQQTLDIPAFESVLGAVLSPLGSEKIAEIFEPSDINELLDSDPAGFVADKIGLTHYEWISYNYLMSDKKQGEFNYEGVVFVEKTMR